MKYLVIIILLFTTNFVSAQIDNMYVFASNNIHSIQNHHSVELTNGDIVMLFLEYEANNDPVNIPLDGLYSNKNIIVKIDSSGNEIWRKTLVGNYHFDNNFVPSTEFFNYNNSIILPFQYYLGDDSCIFNSDTLNMSEIRTNIPAIVAINVGGAIPTTLNIQSFNQNHLCGNNQLISLKQSATTGYYYSYITNNEFNITFKETRNLTLGLIETDTIYNTFNTSFSINSPFKTHLDTLPNTNNFLSNSYLYSQDGVLLDSLAESPFTYTSFNDNFFLSVKNQNYDSKLTLRDLNGNVLKEKSFFNVKIIDAKINNLNEVLILLSNNKVVKTNISFEQFSETEYTNQENSSIKIDFVDNQNPLITNSNAYLISGLLVDKTPTFRNPDKAFVFKGFLSNINNQYVDIKNISNFQAQVYPNPTTGKINVQTKTNNEINQIRILSIIGKEMQNFSFDNISSCTINLTNKTKGIYYIEITTKKGVKIEKIMIN